MDSQVVNARTAQLDPQIRRQVQGAISLLAKDPRPPGAYAHRQANRMPMTGRKVQTVDVPDVFGEQLSAWREYTETPWARIRYEVVGEILRRHIATFGRPVRVLDVGGGDGMDALPLASAGHDVTIVDPSDIWLEEANRRADAAGLTVTTVRAGLESLPPGEWDVVLCHFVLRYRPAGVGDVAALAQRVRPGGLLSVVDVNPAGRVLRALVNRGPGAALAELHAERAQVETFNTDARKVQMSEIRDEAETLGLTSLGSYGNRIANDLIVDEHAKHDANYFAELVKLELDLCDRDPYKNVGFAWQLILRS